MGTRLKQVDQMAANQIDNGFYGQDIISVSQFDRTRLDFILEVGNEMKILVERFGSADLLRGKILANLFTNRAPVPVRVLWLPCFALAGR